MREFLSLFAFKGITVGRHESNKPTGYLGIDINNSVRFPGGVKFYESNYELLPDDLLQLNVNSCNNFNINVNGGINYVEISNIDNGQELKLIFENKGSDWTTLIFETTEPIKWLNGYAPIIETNAKIILYKSNNVIYAEIYKEYIGDGSSDGGSR